MPDTKYLQRGQLMLLALFHHSFCGIFHRRRYQLARMQWHNPIHFLENVSVTVVQSWLTFKSFHNSVKSIVLGNKNIWQWSLNQILFSHFIEQDNEMLFLLFVLKHHSSKISVKIFDIPRRNVTFFPRRFNVDASARIPHGPSFSYGNPGLHGKPKIQIYAENIR